MCVMDEVAWELNGDHTLSVCFGWPAPPLAGRRPRARWRPRLVPPPTLRTVRTPLLGHMPGWCLPLQAVGPWRPVELLGDAPHAFDTIALSTQIDGDDGIVSVTLPFVQPQSDTADAWLNCGDVRSSLQWRDSRTLAGTLRLPHARQWWPHTHGTPKLHDVSLDLHAQTFDLGRAGFRTIDVTHGADGEGFALSVNGTPVFCRGACWTSADLATLTGTPEQLAHTFALA